MNPLLPLVASLILSSPGADPAPVKDNSPAAILAGEDQAACPVCQESSEGFLQRLKKAYRDELPKAEPKAESDAPPTPRRALPAPFASPPFPTGEWQGFPLIGVPPSDAAYPLMKAIYAGPNGDAIKRSRVKAYGWLNASGNWSTANTSNTPSSYWINSNGVQANQLLFRIEREVDSVQTDHIDWGFRSTGFYGTDYRYTMAGGYGSDQLLVNNRLYGFDPTE